jgi:hypothetical protein
MTAWAALAEHTEEEVLQLENSLDNALDGIDGLVHQALVLLLFGGYFGVYRLDGVRVLGGQGVDQF